jgi:multidrug resistance efflux pump
MGMTLVLGARRGSRRLVGLLGLSALLVYSGWIGGPYLRSIVTRDAAVTTWISVTTSPISGYVDASPLYPGQRVAPGGHIAIIADPLADGAALARATGDLERARARLASLERLADNLRALTAARAAQAAGYAAAFRQDLDVRIAAGNADVANLRQRIGLERAQSDRLAKLAAGGHVSQSAADLAAGLLVDQQRLLSDAQAALDRASVRRRALAQGALLLEDGTDAAVAARAVDDTQLDLMRAQAELAVARVDVAAAETALAAARQDYDKARLASILAPAGAMIWSLVTAPGTAVQPGAPVASWIDCRIMLVDVPVSDVELALLPNGAPADVVLEGERQTRRGTVMLTRGAAATIGQADLAAIAKGRLPGIGQVLVRLEPSPADIEHCPIGEAAYVDFPQIGLIDILRARLRL